MAFYRMFCSGCFKRVNCVNQNGLIMIRKKTRRLSHVKSYEDNQNYNEAIELLNKFIRNGKKMLI